MRAAETPEEVGGKPVTVRRSRRFHRRNMAARCSSGGDRLSVRLLVLAATAGLTHAITDNGRVTEVVAVEDRQVDLPCDISTDDPSDSAVLVLWYRDNEGTPTYSFDGRDGRPLSERAELGDRGTNVRATFVSSARRPALRLAAARRGDAGRYRCRVDFRYSPTRNVRVHLTVIIPPGHPEFIYRNRPVSGTIGPLQEGDPLEVSCQSHGGRPPPRVTWFRDSHLLDDTDRKDAAGQVTNVLRLPPLTRDDLHTTLVCTATNNNISSPAISKLVIDMYFRPLSVKILGTSRTSMQVGRSYDLVCHTSGSRPPANVTWWIGERRVVGDKLTAGQGNITSSTLPFTPTSDDNDKDIACRAENSFASRGAVEDSRSLNIRFSPIVSLRLGQSMDPENIREGQDVYFECNIKANPSIYSLSWSHNGEPVELSPRADGGDVISINDRSLVIRNLTRRSAGEYLCRAANPEGEGVSRSVYLTVRYAPICEPGQKMQYGTARNEAAHITCEVDANPADVTFRWQFNSTTETLDLPFSQISSGGLRSSAFYTPKTDLDYGVLICSADNGIGHMVKPCLFHIAPASPPEPLRNCTVINQTSESLEVACSAGFDGGLPQYFVAELYDVELGRLERNLSRPVPAFSVTALPPGLELRLELYAANSRGRSRVTKLDGFTLKAAEKRISSSTVEMPPSESVSVTPILGVLIGVVASLIIIAIGVVACMRNNSRRTAKPANTADLVHSSLMIKDGAAADEPTYTAAEVSPGSVKLLSADDSNPDVVPNKFDSDYEVVESTQLLNHVNVGVGGRSSLLSPTARPAAHSASKDALYQDNITYAELSLPRPAEIGRAARGRDRVIYATIDHGRAPGAARDTVVRTGQPLDQRESVV